MKAKPLLGLLILAAWCAPVAAAPRPTVLDGRGTPPVGSAPGWERGSIDMERDDLGERFTAPPPDVQRPSLLDDKYRGVPGAPAGDAIADPLAVRGNAPPARPVWLGVRLGGGLFDAAAATARAGVAVAATGRIRVGEAAFAALRGDWSQRGGNRMAAGDAAIDVLGVAAGFGATVARGSGLALALIGQLRGELRLSDAAPRTGLGVALGAEVALPATPFTVGARYEQGLTALAAGARDHAMLVEVGVDLR